MIRRVGALCMVVAVALLAQDAGERRKSVRALERQGAQAIPRLAPMVSDPDLGVRIETVKALVEIGTQYSLDPLIQATRDNDPEIQIRATDGLVNFYLPGYVRSGMTASLRRAGDKVVSRLTDTSDQVIDAFIEVRPEVAQALGRLVRGGSSMESRANAARAAGILRAKAAVPDLLESVRTKDTQVLYECLIAFQKIRDRSVGPRISFLLRDLDEKVQVAAIEAAGLLYNLGALPDLRDVLSRSQSRRVRHAALTSIAMLPDPANRALLVRYLADKEAGMRSAAAEGLGRLNDPAMLAALEKGFQEEGDASVRVSLAFALLMNGKLEVSEFSPLQFLVNSLNSAARSAAAQALLTEAARMPEVRRRLYPSLQQGTRDEKIGLARVMAQSGDKDTLPLLDRLTHDANVDVASEAIRALRSLRAHVE